jgi:mono/diheme cytochrome c family protein
MNEQEKQDYLEKYHLEKEKGVPFFPDILFKDAVISLVIFLLLIALAYLVGAPLEARANPADTSYTPRPEWYFLFLFQLLKYFPGSLEVVGVVVLPTLIIVLLFLLPLLDRKPQRYFQSRLPIISIAGVLMVGVIFLTIQAYRETPPPAEAAQGDQTAALYLKNCAACHGASISVTPGVNLHAVIAQGKHEGMPAWSSDLTTDQIDALAGFILSPKGSTIFTQNCGECHKATDLAGGDPLTLKSALEEGPNFPAHANMKVPQWKEVLNDQDMTALINFLIAPDGQRLFTVDCSPCHGYSVGFSGDSNQLREIISKGGMHLDMPPWKEKLTASEIDTLAQYVVDPKSVANGPQLFEQYCSACHGQRIPGAADVESARQIISSGGIHQTMPVWGDVLTNEQLNALVDYTLQAAKGSPVQAGQALFLKNCSTCHGEFGEGGPSPTRPTDIIAPISTAEFLKTRDDFTLRTIISQGQPNLGMSPFGSSNGGPLEDSDIDAIVAFMRSWEQNPPVELPPEVAIQNLSLDTPQIYADLCAQCHGKKGEGGVGPALSDPKFQAAKTDEEIFNTINSGHKDTSMIAWGEVLSQGQIQDLVAFIRKMEPLPAVETPQSTAAATVVVTPAATATVSNPTFIKDILPVFQDKCKVCHGSLGGWDASTYQSVMTSGDHAPVIISGDPDNSILVQKILGNQTFGTIMPPGGKLSDPVIQMIISWILNGAPEQ